ncbi:MAG: gamma-glutamyltransferase [Ignavibacteria bacterium]|nr:gamma-glutamyltransferase [Ignavibacteria bacterium]
MVKPAGTWDFVPLRFFLLAIGLLVLGSCSPPEEHGFSHAVVVSADSSASEVGLAVLRSGGNAVDAAVAVGFALAVTYPEAGNLGGGGFMLIRLADGSRSLIDFRETAPAASFPSMFLDSTGAVVPGLSRIGPLSAGVPGTVSGLLTALTRFGTKERAEVMDRPILLASRGFAVDERLAASLADQESVMIRNHAAGAIFRPDGQVLKKGDLLIQEDLAATLTSIRDEGEAGFYRGKTAERIVSAVKTGGGIIAMEDLARYKAVKREPLSGSYRGYTVLTTPPPSAGGTTILQMLNLLELFPADSLSDVAFYHLIAAAAGPSFADRFESAGDPDAVQVPVEAMIAKTLALERKKAILPGRRSPVDRAIHDAVLPSGENETTHYCVIDGDGNVVSATVSLNDSYGSRTFVEGAGFFLNNVMDDFTVKQGNPNLYGLSGGEPNSIRPGRRMVSSMSPTIVLHDQQVRLVLGGRGGSRIPTTIVQVIARVLDGDLTLSEAMLLPRVHYQWRPDLLYYEPGWSEGRILRELGSFGYQLAVLPSSPGRVQAIERRNGMYYGVSDSREGGWTAGF